MLQTLVTAATALILTMSTALAHDDKAKAKPAAGKESKQHAKGDAAKKNGAHAKGHEEKHGKHERKH